MVLYHKYDLTRSGNALESDHHLCYPTNIPDKQFGGGIQKGDLDQDCHKIGAAEVLPGNQPTALNLNKISLFYFID
jgi:hypothetical protein